MGEASGNYLMHSKHEGQPESEKKGQREGPRLKRKGLWEIGGDSVLNFDLVAAFLAVIDLSPMYSLGM